MVDAPWLSPREYSGAFFIFWELEIGNWALVILSPLLPLPPLLPLLPLPPLLPIPILYAKCIFKTLRGALRTLAKTVSLPKRWQASYRWQPEKP